jgi:hypothetical protein
MDKKYSNIKNFILDTDVCSAFSTKSCDFKKCELKHCLFPKEMVSHKNMTNHAKRHKHNK